METKTTLSDPALIPPDPFFELRLYQVAAGRLPGMEQRLQSDLGGLFPKHGVLPLGAWSVFAGPELPLFVYLTPWPHLHERTRAWKDFYADPAWHEARSRTNAGSELVERYEVLFLRALRDWRSATAGVVMQMVIQQTAVGQTAAVRQAVLDDLIPAWEAAGATVCGAFDVMSGRPLPSCVFFVSWPGTEQARDFARRATGRVARADDGRALLDRAELYLIDPVPVSWR